MQDQTIRAFRTNALALRFHTGLVCLPAIASAQTAEMRGQVTDSSGGVLPGVTVTIRQEATGVERTVVSDEQGGFRVPALQPGPYAVQS